MRIAIFSDNFYPEISGISDSIISLAKELAQKGHQIAFFVPRYTQKDFEIANRSYQELDLGKNIQIHRFFSFSYPNSPTKQARLVIPTFWRWIKVKKFNPDIIYTQDIFGMGLEALLASKVLKTILIGTNHTPITEFLKYGPVRGKLIDKFSLKYVSWYYNHCRWISAPNKIIVSEMRANGFNKTAEVISNPIELKSFQAYPITEKELLKEKLGLSKNTIIYTGRLAPEKNIDVAIKATALVKKKIPDINLVLTGYGSAENSLKKLARKLKVEENIKFFGFVESGKPFTDLYNACDIFVVTSTAEMQCMSMMQAMACGLPVIAVEAWALPEYVNSQNGYLIKPGDVTALAKKIICLLKNPQKRVKLGEGGINYVANFSAKKIATIWELMLEKTLKITANK